MSKILTSKIFGFDDYSDNNLTEFVNKNHISKDDIQSIVFSRIEGLMLFYWKEAEFTHISENLKYSMKQEVLEDVSYGR